MDATSASIPVYRPITATQRENLQRTLSLVEPCKVCKIFYKANTSIFCTIEHLHITDKYSTHTFLQFTFRYDDRLWGYVGSGNISDMLKLMETEYQVQMGIPSTDRKVCFPSMLTWTINEQQVALKYSFPTPVRQGDVVIDENMLPSLPISQETLTTLITAAPSLPSLNVVTKAQASLKPKVTGQELTTLMDGFGIKPSLSVSLPKPIQASTIHPSAPVIIDIETMTDTEMMTPSSTMSVVSPMFTQRPTNILVKATCEQITRVMYIMDTCTLKGLASLLYKKFDPNIVAPLAHILYRDGSDWIECADEEDWAIVMKIHKAVEVSNIHTHPMCITLSFESDAYECPILSGGVKRRRLHL